jgi:hypothetical protein
MIPYQLEEPKELREAFEVANEMSRIKEELEAYDASPKLFIQIHVYGDIDGAVVKFKFQFFIGSKHLRNK